MSAAANPPESGFVQALPGATSGAAVAQRRRAFRALVRLAAARLRTAPMVRLGRFGAVVIALFATALVVGLRLVDGRGAPVEGFVVGAARWSAWLGAGAVALGAANQRAAIDRRDGLEILAMSRGASPRALAAARLFATSLVAARAVCVPAWLASIAAIASAGSAHAAISRLLLMLVVTAFGLITGLSLGMVATFADRARPSGGRALFVTVVLVPWVALDLIGRGSFSLPGALGAVLSLGLEAVGLGRLS